MRQKSGPQGRSNSIDAEQHIKTVRRAPRKKYSTEEKIRAVMSGLRGEYSVAELCRREGIAESLYYSWSKEFLEAGKRRLAGDRPWPRAERDARSLARAIFGKARFGLVDEIAFDGGFEILARAIYGLLRRFRRQPCSVADFAIRQAIDNLGRDIFIAVHVVGFGADLLPGSGANAILFKLAVFSADKQRVRQCFRLMKVLQNMLRNRAPQGMSFEGLSMGMSGDFEIAVEEGATLVRIGQAIFGERPLPDRHYWPDDSSV